MQQPHRAQNTANGGHYSGILEGMAGLVVLVAINYFWFRNNLGFLGVNPHPYWLIVLVLASWYGFVTGLGVGVLSALTLLAMMKLNQPALELSTLFEIKNLGLPLLFVSVGLVVGEIGEIQKAKLRSLQGTYEELQETFNSLKRRYNALNKVKQEMDTWIISQEHTLSTLYDTAQALKSLREDEIYPATLELLRDFIAAEAGSIYLLQGEKLVLTASFGARQSGERPAEVAASEGMMGQAIASLETVSLDTMIFSENSIRQAESGIVVSVPLLTSAKQVIGLVNIEKMPFLKFNQQTINMTSLVGDLCGAAIENARTYQDVKSRDIFDESSGTYTSAYYHKRLEEEFKRSSRNTIPLSLVIFEVVAFDAFTLEQQQELKKIVSLAIRRTLRDIDLVFSDSNAARYNVVLPNTSVAGARVAIGKIYEQILTHACRVYDGADRSLQIKAGVAGRDGNMHHSRDLISLAESEVRVL